MLLEPLDDTHVREAASAAATERDSNGRTGGLAGDRGSESHHTEQGAEDRPERATFS
jgi:hypothetical protein